MNSNQITNLICSLLIITFFSNSFNAKGQNRCNSNKIMKLQIQQHPEILAEKAAKDRLVEAKMRLLNQQKQKNQQAIISIPVVFHVLYNNSEENVSFDVLESQITVLNEDYRRKNTDANNTWPQAADTQIEFCLANIDLNGNYFEGVTRTFTTKPVFNPDGIDMFLSDKGGKEIWPNYLNIYICDIDLLSEGVLGFAPLPGYFSDYDGVVIDYRIVGRNKNQLNNPYNLGRTGTHEIGHWLDLLHIWGNPGVNENGCNVDDGINDTPNSAASYSTCYSGTSCGSPDMGGNFMDYQYDSCMNLFTQGQANKMASSISIFRPYLINHTKCGSCLPSIVVNSNFQSKDRSITSNNWITATNDITNNSDIDYNAKNRITLNKGFSIDKSSNFIARIVSNCGG